MTGSRDWEDRQRIHDLLLLYSGGRGTVLVHGACPTGADAIADEVASAWPWVIERHPANWRELGRRAGFVRNEHMVNLGADVVLAFIRNSSPGASHTAQLAEERGLRVLRFEVND